MRIHTHLGKSIDCIEPNKAKYDKNIKELLADVQILSRIVKYTVAETAHMTLDEIINCIEQNSIQIGNIPIDPGLTNTERVTTLQTEDATAGESYITFDLRFSLTLPHKSVKIIINLEAQKTTDFKKLGYHLENRITYYMARLISSQKQTEFFHSEYDNIKKIYSIWICLECDTDAIDEVRLTSKNIYGIVEELMIFDKMSAVIVRLRNQKSRNESKNQLIAMLEDLLQDEDSTIKKQKLQDKYDMKMTVELERRLNNMCNLSDLIEERGIRLGEERGIRLGEERGIRLGEERGIKIGEQNGMQKKLHDLIRKKLMRQKSLSQIADELEEKEEDILPLYEQVKQELESESAMRG